MFRMLACENLIVFFLTLDTCNSNTVFLLCACLIVHMLLLKLFQIISLARSN